MTATPSGATTSGAASGAASGPASAPVLAGWRHVYSGKVRDLYVPDTADSRLGSGEQAVLVVASDRISAYDHVLATPIPEKGKILTALSRWWFDRLADLVPDHRLVGLDDVVPAAVADRAMLCRRLEMVPVECVARGYLAGSGLVEYRAGGAVCGVPLPPGLDDGSRLPEPIFTPATKAELGEHDENVTFEQVAGQFGGPLAAELRRLTLAVYSRAEQIARDRGILLADTKLEFGREPGSAAGAAGAARADGGEALVLADEVLTPDSSRFWPADEWSPGRPQPSFDKQFVRDWLTSPASGWDRAADTPPPPLPDEVVERTRDRYLEAYRRLTGDTAFLA